jgi:hypothetical protein
MNTEILIEIYERDLAKLKHEVEQYSDAADMWMIGGDITNSGGNLALHILGNLQHFIGATLGNTGYVRDREREFSDEGVPREEMIDLIDKTRAAVTETLRNIRPDQLDENYPLEVLGTVPKTGYFLTHLATHLNYHLGQINYHRRILSKQLKGERIPSLIR